MRPCFCGATLLVLFVSFVSLVESTPARGDAPAAVGTAVQQVLSAFRANDRAALQEATADDYDYNGARKSDLQPFETGAILADQLLYRIVEIVQTGPGVATALVDGNFTGHLNAGNSTAALAVIGDFRLWLEERQQPDGAWRLSALRFVRLHLVSADWPFPYALLREEARVNDQPSVIVAAGSPLQAAGTSSYSLFGTLIQNYLLTHFVSVGTTLKSSQFAGTVQKNDFFYSFVQNWSADLAAPAKPGRYYLDASLVFQTLRPGGGLYNAFDEVTIPVVVK